jgi:seryl-tRNA synthetase
MLQVAFIRNNRELVKKRLAVRNFVHPEIIDELIFWDDKRKEYERKEQEVFAKIRSASKEVGELIAKNEIEAAEAKKEEVKKLKSVILPEGIEAQTRMKELLELIPNLPHASVPKGKTPEENEVVREGGEKPAFDKEALPHWELAKKYDLINFELGNKVTGSGFPFYKNKGAKLQRALIQYFLDYNTTEGYTEYLPPLMVNEASAYGTGQLPDKEGQMYFAKADNFYMIPTAEVPVTNIYRDEIVKENELPLKMTAYTPCFRREAGSYGKDVRGLNRLHQFDKVEIVQIVHPEKSYSVLEEMVSHVEKLLQNLELPYRILRLCGGDMSFASALTYDFEVYSAAQQKWLEVSSVSNFESFQSNRMKIRFKPALPAGRNAEGKTQLVHTLNGSSLALPRIVAALLENNQNSGGISLPKVLHSYFGSATIY